MKTWIDAARIIGEGLEQAGCRMTLASVTGTGRFWQRPDGHSESGIWCQENDWHQLLQSMTGITDADKVDPDYFPCVITALLEDSLPFIVRDISDMPQPLVLDDHIVPVIDIALADSQPIRIALINWPQQAWQTAVASWSPVSDTSAAVTLSLVAGYIPQRSALPVIPEKGAGVWLDGSVNMAQGEAWLWCDGPVAKVALSDVGQDSRATLMIQDVLTETHFLHPPVFVEIACVTLPLAVLGIMMAGDHVDVGISLYHEARLGYGAGENRRVLGAAVMLCSDDGLLAKVDS